MNEKPVRTVNGSLVFLPSDSAIKDFETSMGKAGALIRLMSIEGYSQVSEGFNKFPTDKAGTKIGRNIRITKFRGNDDATNIQHKLAEDKRLHGSNQRTRNGKAVDDDVGTNIQTRVNKQSGTDRLYESCRKATLLSGEMVYLDHGTATRTSTYNRS